MFKVYWTETLIAGRVDSRDVLEDIANGYIGEDDLISFEFGCTFAQTELSAAVQFCEALRKRRRDGEPLSFICMQGEDPNCVGEQGVSDKLPEGYDWTKQDRAGRSRRR